MTTSLLNWVIAPEARLKPLDLPYLDKHIRSILESSSDVESSVFEHPLSVVLVKFSDGKVQCVQVDTASPDDFTTVASMVDDWYAKYGVRAYSIKQAYDKRRYLVAPLESEQYITIEHTLPDIVNHWAWDVPLPLYQLQIEAIEVSS